MNRLKFIIIFFIIIFIILFSTLGYHFLFSREEELIYKDDLLVQKTYDNKISAYGYDINNPNIIIDPFKRNYNTAIICFETNEYVSINVNINDSNYYKTKKAMRHYIGIYNLINEENKITLSIGNTKVTHRISINKTNNDKIDLNNTYILSNNHLIIPIYRFNDKKEYIGFQEIDILGKIYYEYYLTYGYKGLVYEIDEEKLIVLSNNLLVVDRQNGDIISEYNISKYKDKWIKIEYNNNKIYLYSYNKLLIIDNKGNITVELLEDIPTINNNYFQGDVNYLEREGIRFYKENYTKPIKKNIFIFKYKEDKPSKYKIKREFNRLVIGNNNDIKKDSYLVLEGTINKKIYKLDNKINYIYLDSLKGKYSLYIKDNSIVYKINKYIDLK